MNELQQVIDDVASGLSNAENYGTAIVGMSRDEARLLIDAAQLVAPLQDRCELLGRALAAVWSLVGEEDQRAIMTVLDAPCGSGKTRPAAAFAQLRERFGDAFDAAWPNGFVNDEEV